MAKAYRIPDYKRMYPEAGEEVIAVLRSTERKMQYQEYDLKTERTIINQKDQTITVIPSREDSLERLMDLEVQFAEETESVEDAVLHRMEYEQLHKAISMLSDDEQELIDRLFFQNQTVREVAVGMGIYPNAVHKRKNRILGKMKKFFKKN